MPDTDIRALLDTLPFFQGVESKWLDEIADIAEIQQQPRGKFLLREGGDAHTFHVILDGHVAIEMSSGLTGPVTIENLHAGDIFGWSVFMHPYKWTFHALTASDCKLLCFDGFKLRHLCHDNPELGYTVLLQVLGLVSHRLKAARMQLLSFYS